MSRFLFPRWSNALLPTLMVVGALLPLYVVMFVAYGFSPKTLEVGYQPEQPVPFSHALHAGQMGMDCRYCHNTVEKAAHAAVPPTQTYMNCHKWVRPESPKLEKVQDSYKTGEPIEWIWVNKIADYAYFDHSAHVNRGVGCVECHGRIDQMDRAEVESRLQQLIDKNQLAPVLAERAGVVVEGELADEAMVDEELEGEEPLDLEDELEDEEFQDGLDQDF